MKVAVSSQGQSLEDKMDPRFGRTKHFLIVDTDTMECISVDNKQNLNLAQGAGIQAAQNVINEGVSAIVSGNCGPKAFATLSAAKIDIYVGNSGTVREIVEKLKAGSLTKADSANVEGHWV